MKCAIIAVTARGAKLAQKISQTRQEKCKIFIKAGTFPVDESVEEFTSLRDCIQQIFPRYEALIFIAAAGIAVRMIAPYIVHKTMDPAVLVIDELGKHVISLLSGHIGGANRLTKEIAVLIGADPVITTATDVNEEPAADEIAIELDLMPTPLKQLKIINGALAAKKPVKFYVDRALENADFYCEKLAAYKIVPQIITPVKFDSLEGLGVLITKETWQSETMLFLQPRRLVVGIGCRRDTEKKLILAAIDEACGKINKRREDIALLSSTVVKEHEPGLLAAAKELKVPIRFFGNDALQEMIDIYGLEVSAFVKAQIGVGNVCAAAALYASETKKLIVNKEKYEKVTVAIAWEK